MCTWFIDLWTWCAVEFTGPPWTTSRREQGAHRSSAGRPVSMEKPHREWGKRGRRPSGSSPEADGGDTMTVVAQHQRAKAVVLGAQFHDDSITEGRSWGGE
jgi:hypothetical protein